MAVVFVVNQIRLVLGNGAANCGAFDRMKLGEENTPILGTSVNANLFLTHAGFFLARSYSFRTLVEVDNFLVFSISLT